MVFLNILSRKKNVPEELPDLVIDDIKHKLSESSDQKLSSNQSFPKSKENQIKEDKIFEEAKVIVRANKIDKDKSFFNKLLTDINEEIHDLGKLEGWYNNKFVNNDMVTDMKDFWEDKKHELVIKSIGKGFQDKINTRIESLQNLEKEWQDIYLTLIEKEEELKKEERELKSIVSEFMEMCKRRGSIKDESSFEKKE
jgi:hypothetical protein